MFNLDIYYDNDWWGYTVLYNWEGKGLGSILNRRGLVVTHYNEPYLESL